MSATATTFCLSVFTRLQRVGNSLRMSVDLDACARKLPGQCRTIVACTVRFTKRLHHPTTPSSCVEQDPDERRCRQHRVRQQRHRARIGLGHDERCVDSAARLHMQQTLAYEHCRPVSGECGARISQCRLWGDFFELQSDGNRNLHTPDRACNRGTTPWTISRVQAHTTLCCVAEPRARCWLVERGVSLEARHLPGASPAFPLRRQPPRGLTRFCSPI